MRLKPRYQNGVIKRLNTIRKPEGLLYAYCMNNPMKYTGPKGEFLGLVIRGLSFVGGFLANALR